MLCHETLSSYYTNNHKLLFRLRGEFEQNLTLTELEEMMPFERTIHFILMHKKIKDREQQKGKRK